MRKWFLWGAITWTALIAYMCLIKSSNFDGFNKFSLPHKDKYVHFVFYFVFSLLWYFGIQKAGNNNFKTRWLVFITAVFYGIVIEMCQHFFTCCRSADIYDVLANTLGSLCGMLAIKLFERKSI